jgi:hypothetical protein
MTVGYGGMVEGNVGDPAPTRVPTDLEVASWPRDEDVADDERDQAPKFELPKISPEQALGSEAPIGVPVDQTE